MKLTNLTNVEDFLKAVDSCKGDVYLTSQYGDRWNLKSKLSQYCCISVLLNNEKESLELWADNKEDESKLLKFFNEHPETL